MEDELLDAELVAKLVLSAMSVTQPEEDAGPAWKHTAAVLTRVFKECIAAHDRAMPAATAALREALELAWSLLDPFDMPPGAADKINAALGTSGASRGIDAALSHPITPEDK